MSTEAPETTPTTGSDPTAGQTNQPNPTELPAGNATPGSPPPDRTQTEKPADSGADEAFDPADAEQMFGLPEGSLSDCKSVAEAATKIQSAVDAQLVAGMSAPQGGQQYQQPPAAGQPQPPKGGEEKASELEKKVAAMEQQLQGLFVSAQQQINQQMTSRIDREIDSWQSPAYGVGRNRTYKQRKEVDELRDLARTMVMGATQTGQPLPDVEVILRQVRAYKDGESALQRAPQKKSEAQVPLGTPGGRDVTGSGKAKDGPRNIHEVYLQTPIDLMQ